MIRRGVLLSLVPLAVMIGFSVYGWSVLPADAQVPVHWGFSGEPDRYGAKWEAFIAIPGLAAGLIAVFAVLPFIDPRGKNLRRSAAPYVVVWVGSLVLMAVAHAAATLTATGVIDAGGGPDHGFLRIVATALALLFAVIGNVLGKARPNWFFGVRTPWTLSSDLAWDKTHRLAGRLFVAAGVIGLILAWTLDPGLAIALLVAAVVGTAVLATVMSYLWWKSDPVRETATPDDAE